MRRRLIVSLILGASILRPLAASASDYDSSGAEKTEMKNVTGTGMAHADARADQDAGALAVESYASDDWIPSPGVGAEPGTLPPPLDGGVDYGKTYARSLAWLGRLVPVGAGDYRVTLVLSDLIWSLYAERGPWPVEPNLNFAGIAATASVGIDCVPSSACSVPAAGQDLLCNPDCPAHPVSLTLTVSINVAEPATLVAKAYLGTLATVDGKGVSRAQANGRVASLTVSAV